MGDDTTFPSRGLRTKADRQVERMLPNDRLGKNRLPVCPRGQIADVLEPLATPALADAGGHRCRGEQERRRWARACPSIPKRAFGCGGRKQDERVCGGGEWRAPAV